ncbi:MAG: hypothetical protein N3A69_07080 [Leptospiraceae bacterium]|nr:hypothetical protein [Leptospiraceae bacterium]
MTQTIIEECFLLQEKDSVIEIKLQAEELNKDIESKLIQLLHTAYFSIKNNLQINLEDISHIPPTTLVTLLDFAREMQKECRTTSLINAPNSVKFFLRRFELESVLKVL